LGRRNKRHVTKHHVRPQSRCDPDADKDHRNIVYLDDDFHKHWHWLFENLTVDEVIAMIRIVMVPGKHWTRDDLVNLRKRLKR